MPAAAVRSPSVAAKLPLVGNFHTQGLFLERNHISAKAYRGESISLKAMEQDSFGTRVRIFIGIKCDGLNVSMFLTEQNLVHGTHDADRSVVHRAELHNSSLAPGERFSKTLSRSDAKGIIEVT